MARLFSATKIVLGRVFRDRQVLIRSAHGVSHRRIGRRSQLAAAGLLLAVVGWAAAATVAYTAASGRIAEQAGRIVDLEIGYARLITDAADRLGRSGAGRGGAITRHALARNEALEGEIEALRRARAEAETARQALLARIAALEDDLAGAADRNAALADQIGALTTTADGLAAARDGLIEERRVLRARIARLEQTLAEADTRNARLDAQIVGLTAAVQGAYRTVDRLVGERATLRVRLADAEDRIRGEERRADGLRSLLYAGYRAALGRWQERNALKNRRDALRAEIAGLRAELETVRHSQELLFAELRERTDGHVAAVEQGLSFTGLDIDGLIEELRADLMPGAGGPMIPTAAALDLDRSLPEAIDLMLLVGRAVDLRDLANRLPLAVPLRDSYRLSSGFGTRRDPFTGRRAGHLGLDFAARRRTPVYATAPGFVTFAGRNGAYGNLIEIDHGLGIATRYAHLDRIDVAVGQGVAAGQPIGRLGSTGRSTGPHLHYEILVDQKPRNPANFLKAGEHVFQVSD